MLRRAGSAVAICMFLLVAPMAARSDCIAVDFLSLPLTDGSARPVITALTTAYPDIRVSADGQSVSIGDSAPLALSGPPHRSAAERLADASVEDQFHDVYPLSMDLSLREIPWFDPGRARNDAFFRAMWFSDRGEAQSSLVQVRAPSLGGAVFTVTKKRNVACQLQAVLSELAARSQELSFVFAHAGGGFNWRAIAGTNRLSAHSFGIAVDVNAELGQYWKWSGAKEGRVGTYDNRIPPQVISAFERYGFIWGGKWHHFDGMHFEYRPELIVFARLAGQSLN